MNYLDIPFGCWTVFLWSQCHSETVIWVMVLYVWNELHYELYGGMFIPIKSNAIWCFGT